MRMRKERSWQLRVWHAGSEFRTLAVRVVRRFGVLEFFLVFC